VVVGVCRERRMRNWGGHPREMDDVIKWCTFGREGGGNPKDGCSSVRKAECVLVACVG
jgi:hypothetical protein